MKDDTLTHLDPRATPNPKHLIDQVEHALLTANTLGFFERMQSAHETRDCLWDNKSRDGRKHESQDHQTPAFPWDGAPDTESRLVDETINEFTDLSMVAQSLANFQLSPRSLTAPDDTGRTAAMWKQVHAYYLEQFLPEQEDQAGQFIDTAMELGHSIMRVSWHETKTLQKRTIGVEQVMQMFLEAATMEVMAQLAPGEMVNPQTGQPEMTPELQAMLAQETAKRTRSMLDDPANRGQLKEAVLAMDPDMTPEEATRVATSLQRGKPALYYATVIDEARPTWRALKPWVHVWYPPETEDITAAPWVCEALWMDEVTLRTMAESEGWDADWVEQVLRRPGRSMTGGVQLPHWVMGTLDVGIGVKDDVIDDEFLVHIEGVHVEQLLEVLPRDDRLEGRGAQHLVGAAGGRARRGLGSVPAGSVRPGDDPVHVGHNRFSQGCLSAPPGRHQRGAPDRHPRQLP